MIIGISFEDIMTIFVSGFISGFIGAFLLALWIEHKGGKSADKKRK